eukprot:m.285024 g.285024  ORF g.285024 m.285024 type:complete len:294 (-) comp11280_c0_seq1:213-1094(-)
MSPKILILGSTGFIGQATIEALSKKGGATILAGVRDKESAKAKKLGELDNVEIVKADMDDPSTLGDIVQGVSAVFVVTPGDHRRTEITNKTVNALAGHSVPFTLIVSVPLVDLPDTIFGKQCLEIEENAKKAGLTHAIARLPFFIDNMFASQKSIKGEKKFFGPLPVDIKMARVAVSDAGEACAEILSNPSKHEGKTYTISSETFSEGDMAKALTEVLDRKIEYIQIDWPEAKAAFVGLGMPEWQADGVLEIFRAAEAKEQAAGGEFNGFKQITGKEPMTAQKWVEVNKENFL